MRREVRLLIALAIMVFGLITYCSSTVKNPITGENQRVQLSPQQEIALGLQSRSKMTAQYGGDYPDQVLQQYVEKVGKRIVQQSEAKKASYPYEFHLLSDPKTINAFALPGGPVFITFALLRKLNSEAQLAGVLGHEVGHVVARHGAQHLAKQQLGKVLVTAVGVGASDNARDAQRAAAVAQAVNQMVSLKYGRDDELQADSLGFRFMTEAGYNPKGIVELMQILGASRSGSQQPEFFSTHPNPENRLQKLQALIAQKYPKGVPANLESGREDFAKSVQPRLSGGK